MRATRLRRGRGFAWPPVSDNAMLDLILYLPEKPRNERAKAEGCRMNIA